MSKHIFKKGDACKYLGKNLDGIITCFSPGDIVIIKEVPDTLDYVAVIKDKTEQSCFSSQLQFLHRKLPELYDYIKVGTKVICVSSASLSYRNVITVKGKALFDDTYYPSLVTGITDYEICTDEEKDHLYKCIIYGEYVPLDKPYTTFPEKGWCNTNSYILTDYLAGKYGDYKLPGVFGYIWDSSGYAATDKVPDSSYCIIEWKSIKTLVTTKSFPTIEASGSSQADLALNDKVVGDGPSITQAETKYKEGDMARVRANMHSHNFVIGSIVYVVEVISASNVFYKCGRTRDDHFLYSLCEKELEPYNPEEDNQTEKILDPRYFPETSGVIYVGTSIGSQQVLVTEFDRGSSGPVIKPTKEGILSAINIFKKNPQVTEVVDRTIKAIPYTKSVRGIDSGLEIPLKLPKNR